MMTLSWILYCVAITAILAVSAEATERFVRSRYLPRRWAWVGALTISLALPAWALLTNRPLPDGIVTTGHVTTPTTWNVEALSPRVVSDASLGNHATPEPVARGAARFSRRLLRAADRSAWVVWVGASGVLLILLTLGWVRIHRERSRWRRTSLNGREILVSQALGPAVVGFFRPSIVLPEWVLAFDEARRKLVLAHEEEHLRARDVQLLLLANIAFVLMPWNVALWYQVRRLRLAVEIDCDARVLRRHPYPCQYGDLLLDVGQRPQLAMAQMAALSESASFLRRRVDAMMSVHRQSRVVGVRRMAVALLMVTVACMAPIPPSPRAPTTAAGSKTIDEALAMPGGLPTRAGIVTTEGSERHLHNAQRVDTVNVHDPRVTDSLPRIVKWGPEPMTTDSLIRRIFGRTVFFAPPVTLSFVVRADDRVISAGVHDDSVGENPDIHKLLPRNPGGRPRVGVADVSSVDIDRTAGRSFPNISSVIWVRLKPDAVVSPARLSSGAIVDDDGLVRSDPASVVGNGDATSFAASSSRLPRADATTGSTTAQSALGSREFIVAAAKRIYPALFDGEQPPVAALWFLADSRNRILASRMDRSTPGPIGYAEVLAAFPRLKRDQVQWWIVTSTTPFPIVWISLKPGIPNAHP